MDMSGFTKLFNSILHSTIWSEPNHVRILWITMLAMANKDGDVAASVPGLAKMAGISLEETEDALARFQQPDKYSRTPDFDGRRIQATDGGWHLLNHGKYRALMSAEERREYNRRKQAERRAKLSSASMTVNDSQSKSAMSAHTEAEAEAEAKNTKERSATASLFPLSGRQEFQCRIGKLLNRRESTAWDKKELAAFKGIKQPPEEDMKALEDYYNAVIPKLEDFRRRSLQTLLNNFNGEIDRAKLFMLESRPNR